MAGGAITLRAALARYADLLSPVSKSALQALTAFADGEDAARLHRLLSPEGAAEYKAWHQQSRCLLEVLEEFPSIKPPLGERAPPSRCWKETLLFAALPGSLLSCWLLFGSFWCWSLMRFLLTSV